MIIQCLAVYCTTHVLPNLLHFGFTIIYIYQKSKSWPMVSKWSSFFSFFFVKKPVNKFHFLFLQIHLFGKIITELLINNLCWHNTTVQYSQCITHNNSQTIMKSQNSEFTGNFEISLFCQYIYWTMSYNK